MNYEEGVRQPMAPPLSKDNGKFSIEVQKSEGF